MSDQELPPMPPPLGASSGPAANLPPMPAPLAADPLPDAYRAASQANPDHVSQAMEISQRRKIDPSFALANLPDVKNADAAPDFQNMSARNPKLYDLLNSNPAVMGIGWDDLHSFAHLEDHANEVRTAHSILDAVSAGAQDSVRGRELMPLLGMKKPSVVMGKDASWGQDLASSLTGMALDYPEFAAFGIAGAPGGPTAATAAAFAGHDALKQALIERAEKGPVKSAADLIERSKGVAWAGAKGATVGGALAVTGGAAAMYGASPATKMAFEIASMSAAGAAADGRYPTMKDVISNSMAFLGAEVASHSWDIASKIATDSKTRGRGAVGAQVFGDHADNVLTSVGVPVEKWDALHGPDVAEFNKKLGVEKSYAAAKAGKGSVELTAGQYLSADMDKHRDALHDDIHEPGKLSINQLKEQYEARKEEDKAQREQPENKPLMKNLEADENAPNGAVPPPDPGAVNVRVIHHGETAIDASGEPTPEEAAQGVMAEPQTHGPKFKTLPLTEKGREQVAKVGETMKDQNVKAVFSGGSTRTKQTAEAVGKTTPDSRFGGMQFPTDMSGMPVKEFKPILEKQLAVWAENADSKEGEGESFNEFQTRNLQALQEATANAKPGESVALALSSDSVQLFKLIAENGGMPIHGDMIKRMAEKESIKPVSVDAYKLAPNGLLIPHNAPVDPEAPTLPYSPYAGLSVGQRAAEYHFAQKLSSPEALEEYAALPGTMGGKKLDVDEVRALSKDYNENPQTRMAYTLATHEPASAWIKQRYADMLSEDADKGHVLFLSGGGGSGKSTILKRFLGEIAGGSDIVMDSTFSQEAKARQQIEDALASGREVSVAYVHREFESAVKGVVHRTLKAETGGRWVPSAALAQAHVGAQETFKALAETYRGDPRVTLHIFDNPHAEPGEQADPRPMTLAQLHERSYTKEGETPNDAIARLTEVAKRINGKVEEQAHEVGGHDTREAAQPGAGAGQSREGGRAAEGVYGEGFQSASGQRAPAVAFPTPEQEREQATVQAVSAAQQETGQTPIPIPDADPRAQADLSKYAEAARKEAEKMLLKPQLEEIKRANMRLISDERERVTAEAKNQVASDPVHMAYALFKPEGAEHGPSQETIWKKSNDYLNNRLSDEDRMQFDAIAEMSHFSSGDEMVRALLTTERGPSFNMAVKARVDQHMAQFAHLKDTTAMHDEALRAVHTEQSGQLLSLQQQVMEGMGQNAEVNADQAAARRAQASVRWEQAKQIARDAIAAKPVETAGRYKTYYTAERDAAVRAAKAQAEGDTEGAAQALSEQLQNHALAAESARVRDRNDYVQNAIKKQQQADKDTWKNQDYFSQAADIMKRFGFAREDYDPSQRGENLSAWADRMAAAAGEDAVNVPDWIKDESVTKDWRKLTSPQLEDVRNTLTNIKHLANESNTMKMISKGIEREALVGDLVAEAQKNVAGGHTPGADPRADLGERMWKTTERWGNVTYAVETMLSKLDGWKLGGKWGKMVEAKSEAQDNEAARMADDAAWWKETNSVYSKKELIDLDAKKIYIPEIKDSLSKRAMMVAIANTGTDSNARVLKEGRRWSDEQIEAIKGKMEKRDFDVMQALLDRHENNNKPALAEMARRRSGFEPKWIDAQPIQTPFGEYRGGYIPLIRDNRVSSRGMEESSLDDKPQTFKAATPQGMLKERNSHAEYPVSLDMNDHLRALNKVSHYLTMQDWVTDMNGLMNSQDIKDTLIDTSGRDRLNTINNWVKDVAGTSPKEKGSLDGAVRTLTDHSVISQLGTKLSVTLATGTHGIFAVGGVDPENFGPMKVYGGLMNFLGGMVKDPLNHYSDAKTFMLENSKYMAQHAKESESSITEAADRMAGKNKFGGAVRDFAFSAMHGLYNLTITPIWNDAYKTGLTIKDGDHDAAVSYANMIVRGSSPPGRTSDIPTIMHDSSTGKLLFLMHGFADRQYQMMVRAGGRYGVQVREAGSAADVAKATSQFLGTYANVLVIPGMAMAGLKMIGSNDDEREHKILQKHIVRSLSPLTTYPVISWAQDVALDAALGVKGNTSLSGVGGAFDAYERFAHQTESRKDSDEQKAEAAARVASFAVPYPQALNDGAFNLADIVFNGMNPRASDLVRRRPVRERGQ